jgi:glycine/D-amino acid oxidase-like deaminating enzyme
MMQVLGHQLLTEDLLLGRITCEYKNLYIFNGLGTKAVMLAPYFAKQFVANLQNKAKLMRK